MCSSDLSCTGAAWQAARHAAPVHEDVLERSLGLQIGDHPDTGQPAGGRAGSVRWRQFFHDVRLRVDSGVGEMHR